MFSHTLYPLLVAAFMAFCFGVSYHAIWSGHNSRGTQLKNQTKNKSHEPI